MKMTELIIDTDTEYVEKLIKNSLFIESDLITNIRSFTKHEFNSRERCMELTFNDGNKYFISIEKRF